MYVPHDPNIVPRLTMVLKKDLCFFIGFICEKNDVPGDTFNVNFRVTYDVNVSIMVHCSISVYYYNLAS